MMHPDAAPVDTVTTPDFSGPRAIVFEARTLFFLASWMELFGEGGSSRWPLQVCCIGEPPESVRRMAACAGAGVSAHEPLLPVYGGFANKLRGLEVSHGAERTLLLDADILVTGALDPLLEIDADCAIAPAGKPQVPEAQWRLIYDGLGLPLPAARMVSVHGQHGLALDRIAWRYAGQEAEAKAMLPYHNSGVLLVSRRWVGELRELWEDYLRRIPPIFEAHGVTPAHAVLHNDQVALAAALETLQGRGMRLQTLPDAFNARLVHFRAGALRAADTRLLHAAKFAGGVQGREDMAAAVGGFEARWGEAICEGLQDAAAQAHDLAIAKTFLWNLWERWVREVWESGG